jgi:hypothetical protein
MLALHIYGGSLLSVSRDGGIRQWDIEAGRLLRQLGTRSSILLPIFLCDFDCIFGLRYYTHSSSALGGQPLPGTPVAFALEHIVFSAAPSGVLTVFHLAKSQKSPFMLGTCLTTHFTWRSIYVLPFPFCIIISVGFGLCSERLIGTFVFAAPQGQRATIYSVFGQRVAMICDDGSVVVFMAEDTSAAPAYERYYSCVCSR